MIIGIILSVLKVLGIILASLILFLLFLLLIILFVPIRYKASFSRTGEEGDPVVDAAAQVTWLLHLISLKINFDGDLLVKARVAGIPVFTLPKPELTEEQKRKLEEKQKKKEEKQKKKEERQARREEKKNKKENKEDEGPEEIAPPDSDDLKEPDVPAVNDSADNDLADNGSMDSDSAHDDAAGGDSSDGDPAEEAEDAENLWQKIIGFPGKVISAIEKAWYTLKGIYDKIISSCEDKYGKIKKLKKNIHYYYVILTSDLFERTFEKCKKKIFRFLKEILPRKCRIAMEVGFDDPCTTGELLGIVGMMYPLTGDHLMVSGNFEEQVIKGAGMLKGRIFLFSAVKLAIYYFTNKDLKRLIRLLKKEEHKRGRKQ